MNTKDKNRIKLLIRLLLNIGFYEIFLLINLIFIILNLLIVKNKSKFYRKWSLRQC
jgi:hypothetical protein